MVELGCSKWAFAVLGKHQYSLQQKEMLAVETQQTHVKAIEIKNQESMK